MNKMNIDQLLEEVGLLGVSQQTQENSREAMGMLRLWYEDCETATDGMYLANIYLCHLVDVLRACGFSYEQITEHLGRYPSMHQMHRGKPENGSKAN